MVFGTCMLFMPVHVQQRQWQQHQTQVSNVSRHSVATARVDGSSRVEPMRATSRRASSDRRHPYPQPAVVWLSKGGPGSGSRKPHLSPVLPLPCNGLPPFNHHHWPPPERLPKRRHGRFASHRSTSGCRPAHDFTVAASTGAQDEPGGMVSTNICKKFCSRWRPCAFMFESKRDLWIVKA